MVSEQPIHTSFYLLKSVNLPSERGVKGCLIGSRLEWSQWIIRWVHILKTPLSSVSVGSYHIAIAWLVLKWWPCLKTVFINALHWLPLSFMKMCDDLTFVFVPLWLYAWETGCLCFFNTTQASLLTFSKDINHVVYQWIFQLSGCKLIMNIYNYISTVWLYNNTTPRELLM